MSPEEDRTRDAVDSEPKHYQLSYSSPREGVNSMFIVLVSVLVLISMLLGEGVVFIKCAVCCYTVAPRVNFSEEIIKYFELKLENGVLFSS